MGLEADDSAAEIARLRDRLRVLSDATHAFAEATTNYQRLVDSVAGRLAKVIGDTCAVFILSEDETRLDPVAICAPDEEATIAIRKLLKDAPLVLANNIGARRVVESGQPLMMPKLDAEQLRTQSSNAVADFERKLGIHSLLVVPLRLHSRSIGILTLTRFRKESPSFDDHDRDLAQSLADHAALAIGNARAYQAAREAREYAEKAHESARAARTRFSRLEEAGIVGIIVNDFDGSVFEVNETLASIVGYTRAEILAKEFRWADLTPPEWKPPDERAKLELRENGVAKLREKQYIRKDGEHIWVIAGSASIEGTQQVISFVLDINERKQAEADAQRLRLERAADAKFRDLVEAAPDALVILNSETRIAIVNLQTEKLFGYTRDELRGQSIDLLVPEQFRETISALGHADFDVSKLGSDRDLNGKHKNGREFPIEINFGRLHTEGGFMIAAAIRDVTERRKLEEQRFRLAAIVDSCDDAIIGTSLDGIVTSWNSGARQLFGYTAEEMVGGDLAILVPTDVDLDNERGIVGRLLEGQTERTDTVRRTKDGRNVDVAVTRSPVFDSSGKMIGTSRWARDITERKRAEIQLARAKDATDIANRELEAFSYSVAHDLRAPLRGMNGFAQVLLDTYADKLDAEGKDWLQEILLNARRMGELIDALLSLSRVTRTALRREKVDLSAMAHAASSKLTNGEPDRAVEIVVAHDLSAEADPTLLRALVDNLMGNAWKFSSKNTAPKIELGATEQNGERVFFVRDNGAGFDMVFADKLFTPFQRLHTGAEFHGTGVGLASVQRIVHRHGGRIWAEGKVGTGATFYFTLPNRSSEATP